MVALVSSNPELLITGNKQGSSYSMIKRRFKFNLRRSPAIARWLKLFQSNVVVVPKAKLTSSMRNEVKKKQFVKKHNVSCCLDLQKCKTSSDIHDMLLTLGLALPPPDVVNISSVPRQHAVVSDPECHTHPGHATESSRFVSDLLRDLTNLAPPNVKLLIASKLRSSYSVERRLKFSYENADGEEDMSSVDTLEFFSTSKKDEELIDEEMFKEQVRKRLASYYWPKRKVVGVEYILLVDALEMRRAENPDDYNANRLYILLMNAWGLVDSVRFNTLCSKSAVSDDQRWQISHRLEFSEFKHDFLPLCCGKKFDFEALDI